MRSMVRMFGVFFVLVLILSAIPPSAGAQVLSNTTAWDRVTRITINSPWKMPGATLDPGSYVFRLLSLGPAGGSTRTVVLVFNKDETRVLGTFMGTTAYRTTGTDDLVFHFAEVKKGEPEPLLHWYPPNSSTGLEFTYSK